MPNGSFSIGSRMQDINVSLEHVVAEHDGLRSFIKIFLGLKLKLPDGNKNTGFDFLNVQSNLLLLNSNIQLSSSDTPCAINLFDREIETGIWLRFYLDDASIFAVQKYRNGGDLTLRIDFTFTALRKEALNLIDNDITWGVEQVENFRGQVQFVVPKSYWVEKLLPALGYPGFKLIEIPLTHNAIGEDYKDIISEFNQAQDYFNKDDYNKCVAHCRHILDALSRNLNKIKNGTASETTFKWLSKIDSTTFTWIDEVDKSLSAISSKTHHIGLKKDFTRKEAESIYLITLGLMNFAGQAARENQTS